VEDEVGVGGEGDSTELEREGVGVLVVGELSLLERSDDESADQARKPVLERGDLFFDGAGARAHLQNGAGEEAAARERQPSEVSKKASQTATSCPSPSGALRAGSMTSDWKIRPAWSTVANRPSDGSRRCAGEHHHPVPLGVRAIGHDLGARRILAHGGSPLGPPLLASYGNAGTASTATYCLILAAFATAFLAATTGVLARTTRHTAR
jgi:hypothetical protein